MSIPLHSKGWSFLDTVIMNNLFDKSEMFLKRNKLFIFLFVISLGVFFYSMDNLKPFKDYTKRKDVACKVVKHLGLTDDGGYIKIQSGNFSENKFVSSDLYVQYEDGKSYYFSLSTKNMFPDASKDKIIDKYLLIFFITEISIATLSFALILDENEKYGITMLLSVVLIIILTVIIH